LARHEPDVEAAADRPLSLSELLVVLGDAQAKSAPERQEAIACYLSASDGWPEAVQRLGGAFAAEASGLRKDKAD
jgi:hypothetical protein